MYSVYFQDLPLVLKALAKKLPNLTTFCSIEGNAYGDFVIKDDTNTWVVNYNDFTVWQIVKSKEKWVRL